MTGNHMTSPLNYHPQHPIVSATPEWLIDFAHSQALIRFFDKHIFDRDSNLHQEGKGGWLLYLLKGHTEQAQELASFSSVDG